MYTNFIGLPNIVRIKEAQDTINQTNIYNNINKARLPRAGQETQRRYFPTSEDVCIFSENPEMTKKVQQGLFLCRQSGGVPEKLDVFITKGTDKELEADEAGNIVQGRQQMVHTSTGQRSRIIMRKEMPDEPIDQKITCDPHVEKNWFASLAATRFPDWDKNCFSGKDSHTFVHELGHHFHALELHKKLHKKLNELLMPDRQWIADNLDKDFLEASPVAKLQKLSAYFGEQSEVSSTSSEMKDQIDKNLKRAEQVVNKTIKFVAAELTPAEARLIQQKTSYDGYFATNSHEAVAEMFAAMVGGKTLSPELVAIYKKYHGPILPLFKI